MKKKTRKKKLKLLSLIILGTITLMLVILPQIPSFFSPKQPLFQANVSMMQTPKATFAYYTRGGGEPLLMLPGFGMTMQEWDPLLLEKLSLQNTLILFDYPGVGRSSGDVSQMNEEQVANSIISFMDKLHIKKAHILGWSLGSFVAQIIAEKYPDRVDKLVLVSTAPGDNQTIQAADSVSSAIQNNLGGPWDSAYIPFMFPDNLQTAYLTRLALAIANNEAPRDDVESIDVRYAFEQIFSDNIQEQTRYDKLPSIQRPTLIIAGEKDVLLPIENDKRVHARISRSRLTIFPDAGHAVLFQDADNVSALVSSFLHH